jgi:protein-S-isoprenylcysteine O-methyltransferase
MNEKLCKEREIEMKNQKKIIIWSNLIVFILGYIILKKEISFIFKPQIFYFLLESILIIFLFLYYFLTPKSKFKSDHIIGIILCSVFSISLAMLLFTKTDFYQFFLYLLTEMIYHYSEYISVLIYHFEDLDYKMYLLDHSNEWIFAVIFSYVETIIGTIFFKKIKQNMYAFIIGIIITIFGQTFRIGALYTGKKNFTHLLSYEKKSGHFLMTTGFYGISRHPSYFGFLVWAIGTQLMCLNIIGLIGFPLGLFAFFKDRIIEEEGLLIEFFGYDYLEYKKKVGILIPFIHMDKDEELEHLEKYLDNNPDAKNKTESNDSKNKKD